MKLGILGGTFDPIHNGHLHLARKAQEQYGLHKVLFVPARLPPHKLDRRDITSAECRCEMVRLAISGNPSFEISTIELDREEVSYTIDTLRILKQKFPQSELYFILGTDNYRELPSWRSVDEIKKNARLLVARRCDDAVSEFQDPGIAWVDMPLCLISSSEIRARIRHGQSVKDFLPVNVAEYIHKMRLYAGNR